MIPKPHMIVILACIAAGVIASVIASPQIPDEVAVHWGIDDQPDRWGSRWPPLAMLPAVSIGLVGLLWLLPLIGPFRENIESFRSLYGRIGILTIALMTSLHLLVLLRVMERIDGFATPIAALIGMVFLVLGNWFSKLRRNFYVGIRTPWTLTSDLVWEKTHRIGGRLMMLTGGTSLVGSALGPPRTAYAIMAGGAIFTAVVSFVYSAVVFRQADDIQDGPGWSSRETESARGTDTSDERSGE